MDIQGTLIELAEEHLARMGAIPWRAFSDSLLRGKPGETFGCEVGGVYFDVGDQCAWIIAEGGDITLTAFAETPGVPRVERSMVIRAIST